MGDAVIKGVPTVVTEDSCEVVVLAAGVGGRVLAGGCSRVGADEASCRQQK